VSVSLPETLDPRKRSHSADAPATFYTIAGSNDVFWRCKAPAAAIGANVCLIGEDDAEKVFTEPHTGKPLPWTLTMTLVDGTQKRILTMAGWEKVRSKKTPYRWTRLEAEFPDHEGVAIFSRPAFAQSVLAKSMREQNLIRTIAESDDNYFAPAGNVMLRERMKKDSDLLEHAKAFAQQDACIFSTNWLRDRYLREFRERFGRKGLPELHVCRNHIPAENWPERVPGDGRVRVGFMGSASHVWDVSIAYAAFQTAKFHKAKTVMVGWSPSDPEPGLPDRIETEEGEVIFQRTDASRERIAEWQKVVDEHIPWVRSDEYHRAGLPLDIGLCPLNYNDFNMGKSDVKAIEYTISGAAVVCSNIPVYNEFWKHEETCLMANSWIEFAQAVERLIRDPKLRFELVSAAQEKVASERGLPQMQEEWKAAIG